MCMFYFWFYFTFIFVDVLFSFIFLLVVWRGVRCVHRPFTSLHPLPNIQYRKGALLCFNLLLYSVVNVWRRGVCALLRARPPHPPPPPLLREVACGGRRPLRWPVGSHVTAWRGDTSQSLFGLFMLGTIKALPTQDLREYVTAAREKSLSLFSLCPLFTRLLSPSYDSCRSYLTTV